jgi:hypothetical protein
MRTLIVTVAGLLVSSFALGQAPTGPPVKIGNPAPNVPELPPLPIPPGEPPPPPAFGADLAPSTVGSPSLVRPPAPVPGAPIEVPPGPEVWGTLDFLCWRPKGALAPPTVAVVLGGAARQNPINPFSAFQVNDNRLNGELQKGFRLTVGYWLDKPDGTGIEARYTGFLHNDDTKTYTGSPYTALVRPFWDESTNQPALFQLSSPDGTMLGIARVRTAYDSFGLEGNYLRRGPAMFAEEFHWIVGARYWQMVENMTVETGSQAGGMDVGTYDSFTTRNRFFGPQFGGMLNWNRGNFTIDLAFKLAAGAMMEEADIHGTTTAALPGGTLASQPGGFLALASNSGDHSRTKLAFMRDTNLSVGYRVNDNITLRLGYDILWVSNVVRPGEQASLNINPNLLPFAGPPTLPLRPGFRFNQETFYSYGFSVGIAVQF